MTKNSIKVLVVDDSILMREVITCNISKDSSIQVVGTAPDPYIARDKIIELEPDDLVLDVNMPKMNGIEFLKKLMPQYPLPVVVVSSKSANVFDALSAGAVDFVTKPDNKNIDVDSFIKELIMKIKIASIAKVGPPKSAVQYQHKGERVKKENAIIAIGASTGGTEALASILKELKGDLPGILIVQHMPPVFTKMYADRLNNQCQMEVKEAEDHDEVIPNRVIIAAGEHHMKLVKENGKFKIRSYKGEKVSSHCPSVDVLFDSVAEVAPPENSMGIILTGMGQDGAKGLLKMRQKGAYTVGQDEKTCVVYGMPMVAYNIGAVQNQLPLDKIAKAIYKWAGDTLR
ncbi:MAG: chemotaxis response regulator containing a CheY-like receiver domain and a methylesterase domain [Oscillospiraceae bacterium]|nr:chemotaxis response regulator containing a CheY-like receiver domain and a methylesterase domain [Oscillospiraceae bacterium]